MGRRFAQIFRIFQVFILLAFAALTDQNLAPNVPMCHPATAGVKDDFRFRQRIFTQIMCLSISEAFLRAHKIITFRVDSHVISGHYATSDKIR
jgi:hypothetical protein